jgi:hypothetical protein
MAEPLCHLLLVIVSISITDLWWKSLGSLCFFCHSLPFHVSIFIECFLGLFYLKLIIGSLTRDCLGFMLCVSHISNKNPKDWLDSFSMLFLYPLL